MNRLVSLFHGRREAPLPPIQRAPLPEDDQADPPSPQLPAAGFLLRRALALAAIAVRTGSLWSAQVKPGRLILIGCRSLPRLGVVPAPHG